MEYSGELLELVVTEFGRASGMGLIVERGFEAALFKAIQPAVDRLVVSAVLVYWMLGTLTIIKATGEETDGSFSLSEQLAPPGFSPPKHVHHEDDELFYVLSGRVTFEIDDERITATPGSTVYAPHGVPHSYLTEEETRALIMVFKPGFEQFFAAVGRPAESWTIPTDGPTEEELATVSEVAEQYGFEIVGPPLTPDTESSGA